MTGLPISSALALIDQQAVSAAVRRETRNRERALPPISVYRWWARRTEAVNGALLDAISTVFPQRLLVADPFVGGGVIALSALRRGHAFYGQDVNPWVAQGLSTMLALPDARQLMDGFDKLSASTERLAQRAYGTLFSDGEPALLTQSLRVARGRCTGCGHEHRLFPHALVTLKRRKERHPDSGFLACPSGHLFDASTLGTARCPECSASVDPTATYQPRRVVTCPSCGRSESLEVRAASGGWSWELVLVERCKGKQRELAQPTEREIEQSASSQWSPKRSLGSIPDTAETRVLRRHGFKSWCDMYPARQRHVLEQLLATIRKLDGEEPVKRALTLAAIGTAEMAGHLSRWDRFYLKSYEAMASHRFNLTTLAAEPNVLGAGLHGRGTFRRRVRMFQRAADWMATEGIRPGVTTAISQRDQEIEKPQTGRYVVLGSSERLLLPDACVDLVLTDPPYHDDVQYHDLSLPLRAWARLTRSKLCGEAVAIPHSPRLSGHRAYRGILEKVFRELRRVLKPTGRLLFSYANREPGAWVNLFAALRSSGLQPLGYTIVESENEGDLAKRNGRACTLDLILELQPRGQTAGNPFRPAPIFGTDEEAYLLAVGDAFLRSGDLVNGWEAELFDELKSFSFVQATTGRAQKSHTTTPKTPPEFGNFDAPLPGAIATVDSNLPPRVLV